MSLDKSSVISHPTRGVGGNSNYRGNAGANFMEDVMKFGIEHTKSRPGNFLFVDANEGSGTSRDVATRLGIQYAGLDLHGMGQSIQNDFTRSSIKDAVGREGDMVFSHPPYGKMIQYSGSVWGDKIVEGDTSNPKLSVEQFLEMSQVMLLNQREATRTGGLYATLIGDMRKKGEFHSFQADYQAMLPKDELISVAIKMQHNCISSGRSYSSHFVPIHHEYLLLYKKRAKSIYKVGFQIAQNYQRGLAKSWRSTLRIVMMQLGEASLSTIYDEVEKIAGPLIANNPNYKAKVRQTLQKHYNNVQRGVWAA